MKLSECDTPICNALDSNPLDSNDIRAWRTLARRQEQALAEAVQALETLRDAFYKFEEVRPLASATCAAIEAHMKDGS